MLSLTLALPLLAAAPISVGPVGGNTADEERGYTAVKAGTVYLVQGGEVLTGGATVLMKGDRILAVGADVDVPADAHVVNYGYDAVVIPGLVAPLSTFAIGTASRRTADPGISAVDGFDFFADRADALSGGVTSAYMTPARNRLVSGQGAVIKLAGGDHDRVLSAPAAIHGTITSAARSVGGYWEPPIPPTVDVGMNNTVPQLPLTTMGAIVALRELVDGVKNGGDAGGIYGPYAIGDLAELMKARVPWNFEADSASEIRAMLGFASEEQLPLVIHGARHAGSMADEIARAGAKVVYEVPYNGGRSGSNRGKTEDSHWPSFDAVAALVGAGVPVAIAGEGSVRDLRFAAALASRGGLDPAAALRSITLTPAEMFGAADRVGSLVPGKDADLVVLNGGPLDPSASVLATWVSGELAWKSHETSAVVIEVDELHVGDGEVLSPGQLLMLDGRIAEVGTRVSHPRGATVVSAPAAMPGIVDALGFLGMEGSTRGLATDYPMADIVAPGDATDRRVAKRGITTVVMGPRGASSSGGPSMAYKPAAESFDDLVIESQNSVRLRWTDRNRHNSGKSVQGVLKKASDYRDKWLAYEKALAEWKPEPPKRERPKANLPEEEEDEDDEKDDEDEDDDDDKKKKDKKKKEDPFPVTGVWEATVECEEQGTCELRIQLKNEDGDVRGSVRCSASGGSELVRVEGSFDDGKLELSGLSAMGWTSLSAEIDDGKMEGKLSCGESEVEFEAERTSRDYVVAGRPERRRESKESEPTPKGKPKLPKFDGKLEPIRRAMDGGATVIVEVEREDEILECVAAFEAVGIQPVLYGAGNARHVLGEIRGRVKGIMPSHTMVRADPGKGTAYRNPWSEIQNAGIPVAFYSLAEEGAVDLPQMAAYAIANGMSPEGALRALTSDAAAMMSIDDRVGRLAEGLDADVLLLDGSPLDITTSVVRAFVNGREVR